MYRLHTNYSDYTVCFFPFRPFHLSFFVPAIIPLCCHGEARKLISLPLSVFLSPSTLLDFQCLTVPSFFCVIPFSVFSLYSYLFYTNRQEGQKSILFTNNSLLLPSSLLYHIFAIIQNFLTPSL